MRILLAADPMLPVPPTGYGGIERIVDSLVRVFRASGHVVGLAAKTGSTSPADAFFPWPGDSVRGRADTIRNAFALLRACRQFRPEVVHSFSRLGYLALLFPGRIPKVMSYQRQVGGRQIRLAARLSGRSLRFTGCSEFIAAMGRNAGGEWTAIPNFVEPESFNFVSRVPPDAPLVFLSRIDSVKGADLAIAIAKASGRALILAGNRADSGPQKEYWDQRIAPHLGRNGVYWVGEVGDRRKDDLLGRAAALLVPVQWDEPFGIVFAEALACGTPILSCPRGSLPEIVEEGKTGFLFRSLEEGVAAIGRIAEIDRGSCRRAAEQRFSARVCASRYLELYRQIPAVGSAG